VPGTECDLFQVKGACGDVRVVYSPLDAVELAAKNPDKQVVFFGVGSRPRPRPNAMSVHLAKRRGLKNFSLLVSHVLVAAGDFGHHESPATQRRRPAVGDPGEQGTGVSSGGARLQRDGVTGSIRRWPRSIGFRWW